MSLKCVTTSDSASHTNAGNATKQQRASHESALDSGIQCSKGWTAPSIKRTLVSNQQAPQTETGMITLVRFPTAART